MLLSDLARLLGAAGPEFDGRAVVGVTHNAQWTKPGDAFVAIRGARADGHRYIDQAVALGAVAVIGEGLPDDVECAVPYLTVPAARAALADAAAVLAGSPSSRMTVLGVTGTDGKTTTSAMARHLLRAAGWRTGLLSTVGYELPDGVRRQFPEHFTTPESPQVQELLAGMAAAGANAVVVEASSHALDLERVRGVEWDVAIWTQLTREHLDFHGDMEGYFHAKRKLVERAPFAVLNADDPWCEGLRGLAPAETTYSIEGADAQWRATGISEGTGGLEFHLTCPLGEAEMRIPMIGRFNVANLLAAMAGVANARGDLPPIQLEDLVAGAASFPGVPGRMQLVPGSDVRVVIDFAHTPPSLEKLLAAVRPSVKGELWVVLGAAGGNRDPGKWAPIGAAAARGADHAVFTEEDYRTTPLETILAAMESGAREAGRENVISIGDRRDAIRHAITHAAPGDTVLLTGKGPEPTLERGTEFVEWDETAEAEAAIALR